MLHVLRSSPLRVLLVLATLLAAVAVATGSGATFRSSSATLANPLVTGTLLQTNTSTGTAVLSASGLRPGDERTATVTIGNSGTLPATITLAETNAANTFSTGSMTVKVVDVASGAVVYDGDVGRLGTKTLAPSSGPSAGSSPSPSWPWPPRCSSRRSWATAATSWSRAR